MKGTIVNFRGGRHTQYKNQMIVVADGMAKKEDAQKLVGKSVTWKSPAGKEVKGKVSNTHGSKGAVRVLFEKGMPGQSVTNSVEIN